MVVTANLNVSFIRPVHPDSGTLRCVGTLIHRGHRSAFADATLTDSAGLIHVRATATCLMLTGAAHNHDGPPPVRPMDGHEPLDTESLLPHARSAITALMAIPFLTVTTTGSERLRDRRRKGHKMLWLL